MSCLYSSPEVTSVDLLALDFKPWILALDYRRYRRYPRRGTPHAHRFAVQLNSRQSLPYAAVNKDALPSSPAECRRLHQVIPPAKTSTGFSREFSSAISGFRSLLRSEAAQLSKAIALNWTCVLEPFTRGGLSRFENSGLRPQYPFGVSTGPATLDRCCERNVVAPGEYSKWFFCPAMGLYGGNLRPATARGMPAKSALACCNVNPAAFISPSTGPLWPCPISTTSTPPGASSFAACGMRTR